MNENCYTDKDNFSENPEEVRPKTISTLMEIMDFDSQCISRNENETLDQRNSTVVIKVTHNSG